MSDYDYLFKVIVVGDGAVGKTALVIRFSEGRFQDHYKMTIGVDFAIKMVEIAGKKVKLQIWDTGGQERFSYIRPLYYKGAMGVIYVFDITNRQSFDNVEKWRKEVTDYCGGIPALLVANKCDLPDKAVTEDEATEMGVRVNGPFYQASAKTGDNVDDLFTSLAKILMQQEAGATVPLALRAAAAKAAPAAAIPTQAPKPTPVVAPTFKPSPTPAPKPAPVAAPKPTPVAAPKIVAAPAPKSAPKSTAAPKIVAAPAPGPIATPKPKAGPTPKPVPIPAPKPAAASPPKKDTLEEALAFLNEPTGSEASFASPPPSQPEPKPYKVPEPAPIEIPQPEEKASYQSAPAPFTSQSKPTVRSEAPAAPFTPFIASSAPKESTYVPFIPSPPQTKSKSSSKSTSKSAAAKSSKPIVSAPPKSPPAPASTINCPNCGKAVSDRWKFCTFCGQGLK